ncbi:MAG: Ig-like domain-containing protein, partial [bacterium]
MRLFTNRMLRIAAVGLALVACTSETVVGPSGLSKAPAPAKQGITMQSAGPSVRVSEFHYNNPGTDSAGTEKIEISGPAGTDLAGYQIVRYNGSTKSAAVVYTSPGSITLTGIIPASCGTRGALFFAYNAQDSFQNGANDAFALVDPSNQVVEFLAYATSGIGDVIASNGIAAGLHAFDVGLTENPASGSSSNISIQRKPDGTWALAPVADFGACNDDDSGVTAPVDHIDVAPAATTITAGGTQQFTATAKDASNNTIGGVTFTWASSDGTVATANASGLATGVSAGDANITATSGTVVGTAALHVNAAPVVTTITVTPTPAAINQGGTQQFTAIAYDASNQPIPSVTFTWGTSAASIATVNSLGLATGIAGGDASITATSGSVIGTAALHVNGTAPYMPPDIRFSEIHYDNSGTDVGEAIEIEGPLGTSLAGWSIVLYEGNPSSATIPLKVYSTTAVTGSLVAPV